MRQDLKEPELETKKRRGVGRGSKFMVLGRENLEALFSIPTSNRVNLVSAYLVLQAGTGADHRQTKWSAKACEDKVGIGRPRAKVAIAELIQSGLVEIAPGFDFKRPKYLMKPPSTDVDEIFLPNQLVTGLTGEPSVLRRVKETNDALALKLMLSLYRDVILDRSYAIPIHSLSTGHRPESAPVSKVSESGIFNLWHLPRPEIYQADWGWIAAFFGANEANQEMRQVFWETLNKLINSGAVVIEDWVFDSSSDSAEPLFPINFDSLYHGGSDPVTNLTTTLFRASYAFLGDRSYMADQLEGGILIPLPSHCSAPVVRGTIKLRIEPDSPGRRLSYGRRMRALEHFNKVYHKTESDFLNGKFDRPYSLKILEEGGQDEG